MEEPELTVLFDGEIELDSFVLAFERFRAYVQALQKAYAPQTTIPWTLERFEVGSAMATFAVRDESPVILEAADIVAKAYIDVADAAEAGALDERHIDPVVVKRLRSLTHVSSIGITGVQITSGDRTVLLSADRPHSIPDLIADASAEPKRTGPTSTYSYGTVEGRIQVLSSRGRFQFQLYERLYGRWVSCYLNEGQQDLVRDKWDKNVVVDGLITRHARLGIPLAVKDITRVELVQTAGSYRRARGIIDWHPDDPTPAEVVRRARDAG